MIANIVLFFIVTFLSFAVFAEDEAQTAYDHPATINEQFPEAVTPSDKLLNQPYEIGFVFISMRYQEPKMYDMTKLNGVAAAYNYYDTTSSWRYRLEGDFSQGIYHYHGQTWGGTPLKMTGTSDMGNLRALVGQGSALSTRALVTPYSGLGYRFFKTDEDYVGGYKRHITYLYLPIGADLSVIPFKNSNFRLRANLEGQVLLKGKAKAFFSEKNPGEGYNDPVKSQSRGYGIRAALSGDLKIGKTAMASLQPYFQFWRVEDSSSAKLMLDPNDNTYVYEPRNETSSVGAVASVLF